MTDVIVLPTLGLNPEKEKPMKESSRLGRLFGMVLVALVAAAGVEAQSSGAEHAASAGLAHGAGLSRAEPAENLNDSEDGGSTEHCGDIDPSEPCYSNGGTGGTVRHDV